MLDSTVGKDGKRKAVRCCSPPYTLMQAVIKCGVFQTLRSSKFTNIYSYIPSFVPYLNILSLSYVYLSVSINWRVSSIPPPSVPRVWHHDGAWPFFRGWYLFSWSGICLSTLMSPIQYLKKLRWRQHITLKLWYHVPKYTATHSRKLWYWYGPLYGYQMTDSDIISYIMCVWMCISIFLHEGRTRIDSGLSGEYL